MQRATKFAIGKQRDRYSMQAATLQASQDRVLTNAQCPSCGSTSYTQYKPGDAPADIVPVVRGAVRAAPAPGTASVADELAKLVQFRESGVLTEDEFAAQKTKLLNG
jgi:hypothetical protein